jgi:hypothetical protein
LLGVLSAHQTSLFDLKEGMDLTGKDDTTQIKTFLGGLKSKKEREDLAYRSMRTKVANFKQSKSWPCGVHPFGFGKACYAADGKTLLWIWQPVNRTEGQLFHNENGKLKPGLKGVKLPRKERTQIMRLIPSNNREFVKSVRLIFDLYTRVGLSRRAISARFNSEGRRFYDAPFTHALVNQVLTNPAYVGDVHFGKTKSGRHWSFAKDGTLVKIAVADSERKRETSDQLIHKNVHKGLVSRQVWNMAQEKLDDEKVRTSFSPQNPAYYLKPILVCGHCGKNMTGRPHYGDGPEESKAADFERQRCDGRS